MLVEIGEIYYDQTRLDKALEFENQALALALRLNLPAFVTKIRNDLALTLQAKGEMQKAKTIFETGLADARRNHDVQQVYSALHNLAKLHQDFGDSQEAAKLFEESLALAEKDGDRSQAAITLNALGTTYHQLGQDEKALATLDRARLEWRELRNENGEAISLNNLALVYDDMGRPQQAIEMMNEALAKRRGLEDDAGAAIVLRALGGIYQGLGDYDRARSYLAQALETQKQFGDEYAQAITHNSLGVIAVNTREPTAALREFDQALALLKKFGDRNAQATTLSNMANAALDEKDMAGAEARFKECLAIAQETKSLDLQALALHGLGSVYEQSDRPDAALDKLRQALALWHELRNATAESKARSLITQVELKQGDLEGAKRDVEESIRLLESQRSALGSEDLRAYYLASIAGPHKLQIDVLMALNRAHPGKGWDARAFEACERSRARSLLDLLAQAGIDSNQNADPQLASRDRALQTSISAKAVQLQKLAPDSSDFRRLQLEVAELTAERERIGLAMRKTSDAAGSRNIPQSLTLGQVQKQVLDPQTILLEYSLGERRSYLFAVTATALAVYELPERSELAGAAADVFSAWQEPELDPADARKNASGLSAILLSPVASQLEGKRVVIVADGELAQVPFAALPHPLTGQPLIASNEIVALPSASTAWALRAAAEHRKKAPKEIAVVADPVFAMDDVRMHAASATPGVSKGAAVPEVLEAAVKKVRRGGKSLARLEHSEAEARDILALAPAKQSLALVGFQANKANVLDGQLADYRILHFATHGLVDPAHPQLSGMVLSLYDGKGQPVDGFLDMNAIAAMKLHADLVVLSACESGQGKLVGGEGLMSLARAFFNAGASSLVVSDWSVDDEATSELMKRFYQELLGKEHLRPAAALRSAQRSMMAESRWANPYYWAAFTFQGEWR